MKLWKMLIIASFAASLRPCKSSIWTRYYYDRNFLVIFMYIYCSPDFHLRIPLWPVSGMGKERNFMMQKRWWTLNRFSSHIALLGVVRSWKSLNQRISFFESGIVFRVMRENGFRIEFSLWRWWGNGRWMEAVSLVTGCCLVFRIGSSSPGQRRNRNFPRISFLDFRLGSRLLPLTWSRRKSYTNQSSRCLQFETVSLQISCYNQNSALKLRKTIPNRNIDASLPVQSSKWGLILESNSN